MGSKVKSNQLNRVEAKRLMRTHGEPVGRSRPRISALVVLLAAGSPPFAVGCMGTGVTKAFAAEDQLRTCLDECASGYDGSCHSSSCEGLFLDAFDRASGEDLDCTAFAAMCAAICREDAETASLCLSICDVLIATCEEQADRTGSTSDGGGDAGADGSDDTAISVPSLASRTSGVAPLMVFFDAVAADTVVKPPLVGGRREYADLHYRWSFGDEDAGAWAVDGSWRNEANGYVAAHVFERPGAYEVRLEVVTSSGTLHRYAVAINVEDPEVSFGGSRTVCVSTGSDFSGCPSGARHVTTAGFGDVAAVLQPSIRILLRRGDTWHVSEGFGIQHTDGPVTIGAFGQCNSPDARGICANAPLLRVVDTNPGQTTLFNLRSATDVRITDLTVTSDPGLDNSALGGVTDMASILGLRLKIRGFESGIVTYHWDTDGHDQFAIVDCDVTGSQGTTVFIGSKRLVFLGNRVADSFRTHVVRIWQAHRGVVSHNEISGASTNSSNGHHALKLHGPQEDVLADSGSARLRGRTEFVVISDNLFGGSGPWSVTVGPQNGVLDERISEIVIERNRFFPAYGTQSTSSLSVQVALHVCARHVTVRNNILHGQGSSDEYVGVSIARRGVELSPANVRVLNNTIYKMDHSGSSGRLRGIVVHEEATKTVVRNNLIQFTTAPIQYLIDDRSYDLIADHNLLTEDGGLADPDNPSFETRDFRISAESSARDVGTEVPVAEDFAHTPRPQGGNYDLGAFEYLP